SWPAECYARKDGAETFIHHSPARGPAYVAGRVVEQQSWYARKNKVNACLARRSFFALACCLVVAGILAICRVRFIEAAIWPTDVFVGLATTVLAWTQAKRFSELAASYSLAAYEISVVRLQSESIHDPEALSKFVGDAENAFSREHTQWVARKDV
ncbi:MAG: SLATT domain-containing protein, partial [Actinomycetota bacterium]|nr:SLATT domain-containing protein [Actinomycetota bacterium]